MTNTIKTNNVISVRFEDDYIKHLKKMAHLLSIEEDSDLTYSDLIRRSVMSQYPIPYNNKYTKEWIEKISKNSKNND